jgi:trans-aconitate methyltransferase
MKRDKSFGQIHELSLADRAGRYLSTRKAKSIFSNQVIKVAADIGCGYQANIGRILFGRAETLHLVDISVSENGEADHEQIHEGYLPEVLNKIEDNSLDAVLMNNVLEHLTDMNGTLKLLYKKMSINGVLFINVPTWRGKWFLEKAAFRWDLAPSEEMNDHKMYFDLKTLWPFLVAAGFRPDSVKCKTHKFGTNLYAVCKK